MAHRETARKGMKGATGSRNPEDVPVSDAIGSQRDGGASLVRQAPQPSECNERGEGRGSRDVGGVSRTIASPGQRGSFGTSCSRRFAPATARERSSLGPCERAYGPRAEPEPVGAFEPITAAVAVVSVAVAVVVTAAMPTPMRNSTAPQPSTRLPNPLARSLRSLAHPSHADPRSVLVSLAHERERAPTAKGRSRRSAVTESLIGQSSALAVAPSRSARASISPSSSLRSTFRVASTMFAILP